MSDPFTWSINLGRWAGTQVRIHVLLALFALLSLLEAYWAKENSGLEFRQTAAWLALLLLALALRELGQAAMAARLGVDLEEIRLWPLGNLVGPIPTVASRSPETALVVATGLFTSASLALVSAIGLGFADAQMILNPFGHAKTGGTPLVLGKPVPFHSATWWVGWFGYLNWVLFVANLIPALPLDMGRILRALLAGRSRDGMIAPHTARACAVVLGLAGLIKWLFYKSPGGMYLILLAFLIEIYVRAETRLMEEGGFFDDGVFGYDFSQGYTSLDAGAPTVRPYRESALKRWRRRRSEQRRLRREAQEAAEERRVDEILEKLYREGRSALTDEEQRFLVRVSAKYRNKHQPHE